MKKIYDKSPLTFALIWIGIYCGTQSLGNLLSDRIGIPRSANAGLALAMSVFLLCMLKKYGLFRAFGLNRPAQSAKKLLFYLPLMVICSSNLWNGISVNRTPAELCIHILLMLCVGFLEELIFRGFLFEAMAKSCLRSAILVSSLTFGLGHIINLFNGRDLTEVLFQIVLAVAMGFLFVMIYLRSGSILPCMAGHAAVNILSAFESKQGMTLKLRLLRSAVLLVLIAAYLLILSRTAPVLRTAGEKDRSVPSSKS